MRLPAARERDGQRCNTHICWGCGIPNYLVRLVTDKCSCGRRRGPGRRHFVRTSDTRPSEFYGIPYTLSNKEGKKEE
jgi:hypothetical protein